MWRGIGALHRQPAQQPNGGMAYLFVRRSTRLHGRGVASLDASGPRARFGLATALGDGDVISNRGVDAIGGVSGGVRLHGNRHEN